VKPISFFLFYHKQSLITYGKSRVSQTRERTNWKHPGGTSSNLEQNRATQLLSHLTKKAVTHLTHIANKTRQEKLTCWYNLQAKNPNLEKVYIYTII
jgi:hypothetical protein